MLCRSLSGNLVLGVEGKMVKGGEWDSIRFCVARCVFSCVCIQSVFLAVDLVWMRGNQ